MDFINKIKNNKALFITAIVVVAIVVLLVMPKIGALLLGVAITLVALNWDKIKGPAKAYYAKAEAAVKAYIANKKAAPSQDAEDNPHNQ